MKKKLGLEFDFQKLTIKQADIDTQLLILL